MRNLTKPLHIQFISGSNRLTLHKLAPAVGQLTHLIYGPVDIDFETNKIEVTNHHDLDTDTNQGYLNRISSLKKDNPGLSVLLSVGQLTYSYERALKYVALVNNAKARREFAENVVEFANKYGYDGINLTWEFPRDKKSLLGERPSVSKNECLAYISFSITRLNGFRIC